MSPMSIRDNRDRGTVEIESASTTRRHLRDRRAAWLISILIAPFAWASLGEAASAQGDDAVVTQQSVLLNGGRRLAYAAEVGRVPIRDVETGEAHGYMGYIAYRVAQPSGAPPRALTFVWNGGPGSNSSTLHFEAVGPKRGQGAGLIDNAETWLADTDLVFVDPIGTGFSRPAKAEYAKEFYGTVGDVASVTEFVRAWRLIHGAEDAPIFLAGESWGAGRAGSVGYALLKRGVPVKGLVLISGGSGLTNRGVDPILLEALRVVDMAELARHHGRAPPDLAKDPAGLAQAADQWARNVYAPALGRREALSDSDRETIVTDLSRFTGVAAANIDRKTLMITPRQFREGLLRSEGKTLNIFDMRLTQAPPTAFAPAVPGYLRRVLGYHTDLPYLDLEPADDGYAPSGKYPTSIGEAWNYATIDATPEQLAAAMQEAVATGGGPPRLGPPLPSTGEAVGLAPNLKVVVAAGRDDSLNSCTGNAEVERSLAPTLKSAIRFRCYDGGHMFYRDPASRLAFARDVRALIADARK